LGKSEHDFFGGQFICRTLGLGFSVQPGDVLLFDSNLFHEVASTVGTRFNITAYTRNETNFLQGCKIAPGAEWLFKKILG